MAFKFPVLKPKTIDCSGLPVHDFKCLTNKEIIGKGAYGAVFTANWQTVPDAGGKSAAAEKVVVKKLLGEDILDKKTFVKEARIIQELKHPNIVKFKGICNNPFALILEYVYFDFQPFGIESKVSSLAEFLGVLEGSDCDGFVTPQVISTICKDVALGLKYLHDKDVAHRDLKPANILVTNQHYCDLTTSAQREGWEQRPLLCKLTDFGESRSTKIQTNSILQSQTARVNRGTPVYMAPEMLIEAIRLPLASGEDLKRADIWSLGMTLFVLLNPCVKYPNFDEIQAALREGKTPLQALEHFFITRKLPTEPCKYQHKHATDWYSVNKIWLKCAQFDPDKRPKVEEVVSMISQGSTMSTLNIPLKVSHLYFLKGNIF